MVSLVLELDIPGTYLVVICGVLPTQHLLEVGNWYVCVNHI